MSENVEIRQGESVTSLVDELATAVTEDSLTVPADRAIGEGEWVRFTIRLEDGTLVMEGVGRSRGSMPRGNPLSHHDLVLGELQFDERNEIMWERLLLAAESARRGDETGTISLGEGSMQELASPAADRVVRPPPSAPPPPSRPLGARASGQPSKPPPPSKPARASKPPPVSRPLAPSKPALDAKPPSVPAVHRLEIPPELVERARRLSARLSGEVASRSTGATAEDAVLATALRMGLAALEAQEG